MWLTCQVTGFLSIGQAPFERSDHFHILLYSIAPIFSSITSHHYSSCTSNATLISFSACNCYCNLKLLVQVPSTRLCKACFFLSKLACNSALPLTSLSILCCKMPVASSNLWITSSSSYMFELSKLHKCTTEPFELPTCSTNLSELSTCSTELFDLPTCSIELFGLFTYSIELFEHSTCLTDLTEQSRLPTELFEFLMHLTELSGLPTKLSEFSMHLTGLSKCITNLFGCLVDLSALLNVLSSYPR